MLHKAPDTYLFHGARHNKVTELKIKQQYLSPKSMDFFSDISSSNWIQYWHKIMG